MGCHFLLQGIFLTQESNPGLLHCGQALYPLSHQGSPHLLEKGSPSGSEVNNPPANAGDVGSIPGSGKYPGEANGNLVQHSCLGNIMDRGAWQVIVHGPIKECDMTERVHTHHNTLLLVGGKKN